MSAVRAQITHGTNDRVGIGHPPWNAARASDPQFVRILSPIIVPDFHLDMRPSFAQLDRRAWHAVEGDQHAAAVHVAEKAQHVVVVTIFADTS